MKELNIIHLFPDLLNLYGEKGNIAVLKKRSRLRDIEVRITEFKIHDKIDFSSADIVIIGGGSDKDAIKAWKKLFPVKDMFLNYRDDNGVILAVTSGYELLGASFEAKNKKYEGLSLCDFYSEKKEPRLIGNIKIETQFGEVAGFENHSARFYLSENTYPLGKVIIGYGNNEYDKTEGIIYKNIFATNLHGPLLPKNPDLADEIIKRALMRKYGEAELSYLSSELEEKARNSIEY